MTEDMQREFASREQMVAYLREQFPAAATRDDHISGSSVRSVLKY
jgi:deoxyribodipyrimidine photo-lyase